MKWNSPIEEKTVGDLKVTRKFAWFPTQVGGEKVWLEKYEQLWEYVRRPRVIFSGNLIGPTILCNGWDLIGERTLRGMPLYDNPPAPPGSDEQQKREWLQFQRHKKKETFNAG
jgi:hypothetical protein